MPGTPFQNSKPESFPEEVLYAPRQKIAAECVEERGETRRGGLQQAGPVESNFFIPHSPFPVRH
jgi:hypothetical protein